MSSKMIPVRKGRFSEIADWREQYKKKLVTPQEAASVIRSGDSIDLGGGATLPIDVELAMSAYAAEKHLKDITLTVGFLPNREYGFLKPECEGIFDIASWFYNTERNWPQCSYIPNHIDHVRDAVYAQKPRVVAIAVSPPDENGWMGRSCWPTHADRKVLEAAEVVIATVNPILPQANTDGENHVNLHVSEVDFITEENHMPFEINPVQATPEDITIAGLIAERIYDGCCIQMGQGGLADTIGRYLLDAGKKDLGIHSELVTNSALDLMEAGVVNNSKKKLFPGQTVGAIISGNRELWKRVHHNKDVMMKEISWVNNINVIAQNDDVVSINSAICMDLAGQVCAESMGSRMYSGTGGQFCWVYGSQMSKNGQSFITFPSSYVDRKGVRHSKINMFLPLGSQVTTPRNDVQYIATEYGIADLRYQPVDKRAKALISIAHPDFRDELTFEAKKYGYIY